MLTTLNLLYRPAFFGCLFTALIFLFSQSSNAQMETDSLQVVEPTTIPIVKAVQEMGDAIQEFKTIENKIELGQDFREIDSVFPIFQKIIQEQKIYADHFINANPNKQKIDNLYEKWYDNETFLDSWLSIINTNEERNETLSERISFLEKTWDLTYENARIETVPDELLTSIGNILSRAKQIKKDIKIANYEYLRLESKINQEIIEINNVMERLLNLKNSEVYNLFYARHKPLWQTIFSSSETKKEVNKPESVKENLRGSLDFFHKNKHKSHLYLIIIILISVLINYLKNIFLKYEYKSDNINLQIAKDVISKQTIASIIFLTLLTTKLFLIAAPQLLEDSLILLLLVSSIPIIKPSLSPHFKNILYFVVILFIIDTAKTYIWFSSVFYRIYLLAEILMVMAVVLYFTHSFLKTQQIKLNKFSRFLIRLVPLFYIISLVAIISNILGYTNLTDLSLNICAKSGVITMIFYCILLIVEGISVGLIHRHYHAKTKFDQNKKHEIEKKLLQIIRIVVSIVWFIIFLKVIDQLRPLTNYFTDIFSEPYKLGSLTFTIGSIGSFLLILISSFIISRFIAFIINNDEGILKYLKLPKGVPAAISLVVRYFIIGFGIILALSSLGINLSNFNLMAGALGLGIGFGLQTVISNFVSGLILVFERPILTGDTIEVDNLLGTVNRIGVRSSSIRTFDGAEVIVPNNNLIGNDLINWTLSDSVKRVEIAIGTTYDADPNTVLGILKDIALSYPDSLKEPPPQALFSDFGDSSLNFVLRFWVNYEISLQAKSDVSVAIYNSFKEANIEIPFPQQDVTIKNIDSIVKPTDSK